MDNQQLAEFIQTLQNRYAHYPGQLLSEEQFMQLSQPQAEIRELQMQTQSNPQVNQIQASLQQSLQSAHNAPSVAPTYGDLLHGGFSQHEFSAFHQPMHSNASSQPMLGMPLQSQIGIGLMGGGFKSRFRGVYRCGKRWKAQLQSQGVQFYLGTYDTEEEAARAYDVKARLEKGSKTLTNFDVAGTETDVCRDQRLAAQCAFLADVGKKLASNNLHPSSSNQSLSSNGVMNPLLASTSTAAATVTTSHPTHHSCNSNNNSSDFSTHRHASNESWPGSTGEGLNNNSNSSGDNTWGGRGQESVLFSAAAVADAITQRNHAQDASKWTSGHMQVLSDRLNQITQRCLLVRAAHSQISELHMESPDTEKEEIMQSLNEEIVLLSAVRVQLEEAISRCYALGLGSIARGELPSRLTRPTTATAATTAATVDENNDSRSSQAHQRNRATAEVNAPLEKAQQAAGNIRKQRTSRVGSVIKTQTSMTSNREESLLYSAVPTSAFTSLCNAAEADALTTRFSQKKESIHQQNECESSDDEISCSSHLPASSKENNSALISRKRPRDRVYSSSFPKKKTTDVPLKDIQTADTTTMQSKKSRRMQANSLSPDRTGHHSVAGSSARSTRSAQQ